MWLGNFVAIARIKRYNNLLTGCKKIPAYEANKTKYKEVSEFNFLNKTIYIEVILAQEYRVRFHIIEEARTESNKYGNARQGSMKLS